jgi:hypothetical protein
MMLTLKQPSASVKPVKNQGFSFSDVNFDCTIGRVTVDEYNRLKFGHPLPSVRALTSLWTRVHNEVRALTEGKGRIQLKDNDKKKV